MGPRRDSGAAIAAGLAPLAVGTETDGSIVSPASMNGVMGLKPTVGTVPTTHVVPISASQDSPGPMGRHVADVAVMFGVLAQQSPRAVEATSLVVAKNWRTGHPATDQMFDEVVTELRRAGLSIVERDLAVPGEPEGRDELTVLLAELVDDLGSYLADRAGDGVRSLADVIPMKTSTPRSNSATSDTSCFSRRWRQAGDRARRTKSLVSETSPGRSLPVLSRASRDLTSSSRPPTGPPGRAT